jgi:hypothetical protein
MTGPSKLRLIDDEEEPDDFGFPPSPEPLIPEAGPKVFVRAISVPPGAPWEQGNAATLDARHGAPLPLSEVVYRMRRLEPWAPGRAGRYAAFYVRSREIGDDFIAHPTVDGRTVTVSFLSFAAQKRRLRKLTIVAGIAVGAIAVGALSVASALSARERASEQIVTLQRVATLRLRDAEAIERLKQQTRLLDAERVRGQRLSDVLNDIAWASRAKSPDVMMQSLHWDHGYMAFEVRGEGAAFRILDRPALKSPKPVRKNIWLWGVPPAEIRGAPPAPIAAKDLR